MNSRHAAYHALLTYLQNKTLIIPTLEQWQRQCNPSQRDFALAYEIASGSAKMALHLDEIAKRLSKTNKLSIKLKEKALLRTAVYQYCFMSKLPAYAIINETIEIAKAYCHSSFVNYLNAILRQLVTRPKNHYEEDLKKNFAIYYSYPQFYVDLLIANYGKEVTKEILNAGNQPPTVMARLRGHYPPQFKIYQQNSLDHAYDEFKHIAACQDYYIQNETPAHLAFHLYEHTCKHSRAPFKKILDLCASPGGKVIIAHELYEQAAIVANDVSEEKIARLKDNLNKYNIAATVTCGLGQNFSSNEQFDLIILDLPCSNSGVLNKRPEARWRLNSASMQQLHTLQLELFCHAIKLLESHGFIWYMTCSILKSENERFIEKMAHDLKLTILYYETILPTADQDLNENSTSQRRDGGFAALLMMQD